MNCGIILVADLFLYGDYLMRSNRGLTVIELLVILAIIGVLLTLFVPMLFKSKQNSVRETFVAQVVNTRDLYDPITERNVFRVDVRKANPQPSSFPATSEGLTTSSVVDVLDNTNAPFQSKYNSEDIQVNLVVGQWYQIEVMGVKDDRFNFRPNILSVQLIPPPPNAEVNFP